jgi:hypothetical protein
MTLRNPSQNYLTPKIISHEIFSHFFHYQLKPNTRKSAKRRHNGAQNLDQRNLDELDQDIQTRSGQRLRLSVDIDAKSRGGETKSASVPALKIQAGGAGARRQSAPGERSVDL